MSHNLRSRNVDDDVDMVQDFQISEPTQTLSSAAAGPEQVNRPSSVGSEHVATSEDDEIMEEDGEILDSNWMSLEAIQRKIEMINRERALKEAREQFVALRLRQIARFSTAGKAEVAPSTSSENIRAIRVEKNYPIKESTKYEGKTQKEYEQFPLNCLNAFETRSLTYAINETRFRFGQNYLTGTSALEWKTVRDIVRKELLTWQFFVDFLQEKLKSKHVPCLGRRGKGELA